ncbi:MAG: hypothetical protein AB7S38_18305 [Vulcanimicrobiota bacterium]
MRPGPFEAARAEAELLEFAIETADWFTSRDSSFELLAAQLGPGPGQVRDQMKLTCEEVATEARRRLQSNLAAILDTVQRRYKTR